jgi:ABC-2 type transport system ATP-binding protein
MMAGTEDNIVEVRGLSREFEDKQALKEVDFTLPKGVVMGLVGENGAGKTTLIKHMLGLLRAQKGTVQVFGNDPVKDPVAVLSRIGYLSEDREMLDWMTLDELMAFTAAFYPDWDWSYADNLVETFRLDRKNRICNYSRGQRAQAGLILAVAHHPDLLLLDEPSSGLDPIVRRDILSEIIHAVTDAGKTVLFSSHLLDEVERVADTVTLISGGEMILTSPMDDLLNSYREYQVKLPQPVNSFPVLPGMLRSEGKDNEWTVVVDSKHDEFKSRLQTENIQLLSERHLSLNDIFIAKVGRPVHVNNEE